jgi:hypothetical protein
MALTVANVDSFSDDVFGRHKVRIVEVTFDSSYASGGESLTPSDVGLSDISIVLISPDANALEGYVVAYDYTAEKLMVFEEEAVAAGGPLVEEGAVNLSTLVVRLLILGH